MITIKRVRLNALLAHQWCEIFGKWMVVSLILVSIKPLLLCLNEEGIIGMALRLSVRPPVTLSCPLHITFKPLIFFK
jgi:hypothetical protein